METLYPWQQRYNFIGLLLIAHKPLYLEHMSSGATSISGSTCCHKNLVAMANEKYFIILACEGV